MECGDKSWIWEHPEWPRWRYDLVALLPALFEIAALQGRLLGRLADVGFALREQASLGALTDDVVKTSAIEGEVLDVAKVRSSLARRLGVDLGALAPVDRHVEGVVEMVLDATLHCDRKLDAERLFGWHAALFPTGRSGSTKIRVAQWRDDANGAMQVVSGPIHEPKVHYQAPPATQLRSQMRQFFAWANADSGEPTMIKAGLAHFWFVTLHPFEDGNGRIGRAIGDLFLARGDGSPQRFYSLSSQIQRERAMYYKMLERTSRGDLDVTGWLAWFLGVLQRAVESAHLALDLVLARTRFWQRWADTPFNARHIKVINRAFDGLDGKLTSVRWGKIARCSADTALRDINELIALGALRKAPGGGRSTAYEVVAP